MKGVSMGKRTAAILAVATAVLIVGAIVVSAEIDLRDADDK